MTLIDEKTKYQDFFTNKEMLFYKSTNDLSESIIRIQKKQIQQYKEKYFKYFNSDIVAEFIINKTFEINKEKKYFWDN